MTILLGKKQLDEFKALYKEEFGNELSDEDALESATRLINLVKAVYKPITKADFDEFIKKKQS